MVEEGGRSEEARGEKLEGLNGANEEDRRV